MRLYMVGLIALVRAHYIPLIYWLNVIKVIDYQHHSYIILLTPINPIVSQSIWVIYHCFDPYESSISGGFLKWEAPKASKSLDRFRFETHGDLGISHQI